MGHSDSLDSDVLAYLERHQNKQLLRFVAVGSVDDGKSTMIGRLLHDTQGVYEDQIEEARKSSAPGAPLDFSLLTDGLAAEREQGITIDVAYRYFTTARRKFIIADTPGHVQYTRNMATGASTANLAIILIDARLGVLAQSRRHAHIGALLGIPHLVVAINKMDLVAYGQARFEEIRAELGSFLAPLGFHDVTYLPISALLGDNVVTPSEHMTWYHGPTLLEHLETVDIRNDRNMQDFRLPVQVVIRPHQDYRGFAGQIASGTVRPGDPVTILPSGKTSRVKAVETGGTPVDMAFSPMSVTLRLDDEIDISRGDMIVHSDDLPYQARTFDAHVVWMAEKPLDRGKSYIIKHTTRYVRAGLHRVAWRLDMETLEQVPTDTLELNDIGRVTVTSHQTLFFEPYRKNRATGSFVIVDSLTNVTVGAGMVITAVFDKGECRGDSTGVSELERRERMRQKGATICLVGPEATAILAYALERRLFDMGYLPHVIATPGDDDTLMHRAVTSARVCNEAGLLTLWRVIRPPSDLCAQADARLGADHWFCVYATQEGDTTAVPPRALPVRLGAEDREDGAADRIVQHLFQTGILLVD